ncbi:MAG: hypothetical protein N2491_12315 [Negativicutes bacterium]|nr:hypothetical protein [Negativicutes bacterium]
MMRIGVIGQSGIIPEETIELAEAIGRENASRARCCLPAAQTA